MSSTSVSAAAGAAAAQGILDGLNAPAGAARIDVYGGVQPAPGGAAGTLICSTVLLDPPGTVVAGALVLSVPSSGAIAVSSVTPTWARLFDGDGVRYFDFKARLVGDADDPADPAVLVVMAAVIEPGALLRVSAGSITFSG